MKNLVLAIISLICCVGISKAQKLEGKANWKLGENKDIVWDLGGADILPYHDHLAMSGQRVDMILEWGVDAGNNFKANRLIRWPMLRTLPDDTHASLQRRMGDTILLKPKVNGKILSDGKVRTVTIRGNMEVESHHTNDGVESVRTIFPSVLGPAIIDLVQLKNVTDHSLKITVPDWKNEERTEKGDGLFGAYVISEFIEGNGSYYLAPGETMRYAIIRTARETNEVPYYGNASAELAARQKFLDNCAEELVLETPDPVLDRLFYFSKIRAMESIFSTRGGLMHAPGGYNKYLAAIWANDQAEYINPFFPFMGSDIGEESAINSFRHFAKFMNPEYKPIPSSIVAEGRSYWNGAGDRGDMAMIAYGASRFALASGNMDYGKELMPLIKWCLEYLQRNQLPDGTIKSDSDELEGRFPSGEANLSTISLYYDALLSTSYLELALNNNEKESQRLQAKAQEIKSVINKRFKKKVEGYDTYQYFEGNRKLRSWICFPLTVGIYDRAEGTVDALFSPKLWTKDGLVTESGATTVWDRSTLYALRGVFQAGFKERGVQKLKDFSVNRLLGDHVPYVIEAYPEGNQSHLSAESGLYCRIFTEGIFGIRPTGFSSFDCVPQLPFGWSKASLNNIRAFGRKWNMTISRAGDKIGVLITDTFGEAIYNKTLKEGQIHHIKLYD